MFLKVFYVIKYTVRITGQNSAAIYSVFRNNSIRWLAAQFVENFIFVETMIPFVRIIW